MNDVMVDSLSVLVPEYNAFQFLSMTSFVESGTDLCHTVLHKSECGSACGGDGLKRAIYPRKTWKP